MGIGWLVAIAAGAAAVWAYGRWFERRSLYHPRVRFAKTPAMVGLPFEEIRFVAEDAVLLHGWWIAAPDAPGTVLYCHGNGDNVGDLVDDAATLHTCGWNVFLWDYRGYGQSRGRPSEKGTYRDARAAYEVVRARHGGADRPPVLVIGRSLGGAVALYLATRQPVSGLVLESSFTSTPDLCRLYYPKLPAGLICRFRYPSLERIRGLRVPLLVAHGRADDVVPFAHGRALYEAAPGPKRFVELRGPHQEVGWAQTPEYLDAIANLAASVFPARP